MSTNAQPFNPDFSADFITAATALLARVATLEVQVSTLITQVASLMVFTAAIKAAALQGRHE